jgi:hypothetical protein
MRNWAYSWAFRLAITVIATLGMLLSPIGGSASHHPAALMGGAAAIEAERAVQIADHGHVHDSVVDEDDGSHSHGHNPADHSHATPNLPPDNVVVIPQFSPEWHARLASSDHPQAGDGLDRPPRSIYAG